MNIIETRSYNGAEERIQRLGIDIFEEIIDLLEGVELRLLEEKIQMVGQQFENSLIHFLKGQVVGQKPKRGILIGESVLPLMEEKCV